MAIDSPVQCASPGTRIRRVAWHPRFAFCSDGAPARLVYPDSPGPLPWIPLGAQLLTQSTQLRLASRSERRHALPVHPCRAVVFRNGQPRTQPVALRPDFIPQTIPFASPDPSFQGHQPAIGPVRTFHPLPAKRDVSGRLSGALGLRTPAAWGFAHHSQARPARAAVSGSSSYGLAVHLRCSPRWNRSNAAPSVTGGGELLPEADFHRPGHATRRRTSAGSLPALDDGCNTPAGMPALPILRFMVPMRDRRPVKAILERAFCRPWPYRNRFPLTLLAAIDALSSAGLCHSHFRQQRQSRR